jgi:hypothetical protein
MPIFISLMCLLGMGLARFLGSAQADPAAAAVRGDLPMRLLRWAASLLSAQREEWGRAMLGELDRIAGRAPRWRFAVGCAGAVLLLPPWGRAAAAVWALGAVAAGGAGLYAFTGARYGLGAGGWVFAAVGLILLVGCTLAASVTLRRDRDALPGLLCGLFVTVAWLAVSGFTFYGILAPTSSLAFLELMVEVPLLVGVAGTLWGGSAAAGRRTAWLAGYSAGLGLFLYGTLAVAVLGPGGPPEQTDWTASAIIGDRLGDTTVCYLWLLPLTTAALGWAAAAATIRMLPDLAAQAPLPLTPTRLPYEAGRQPSPAPHEARPPTPARHWSRTARLVLVYAVVTIILILAVR